jgi:hypothetical protein
VPFVFSADGTLDIGKDSASPMADDYLGGEASAFTGSIEWIQIAALLAARHGAGLSERRVADAEPPRRRQEGPARKKRLT